MDAENMVLSYFHIPEVQWWGGGGEGGGTPLRQIVSIPDRRREKI
jgi:hypothetical protein